MIFRYIMAESAQHSQSAQKVRHIAYANLKTRILSFDSAPKELKKRAAELASGGYFYQGYNTKTSCFACGVQHDNWSEWENVLEEHYKDNPSCNHVLLMKHKSDLQNRSQSPEHSVPKLLSNAKYPEYGTFSIRKATFNETSGFLKQKSEEVAKCGLFYKGYNNKVQCYHCGVEISIDSNDDPIEKHSLLSPNCEFLRHQMRTFSDDAERIRQQLQCKVCLNAQVMVTFRPCGHLATCRTCADQLQKCPICRTSIMEKVNTYL
ncbi:baculoviral IAP repeat-containing protein 2-like isoform X2 [Saccostrea cucullata]|uniref:baculoviral IAP repeat-containing protein 2-like isoform X2 n=1 Tax=Saccostrea cuccullata TaxID=36930 RepID=UPI002ED51318